MKLRWRGLGHQASSFTFAAFAASRALNLSHMHDKALVPAFADQIDAVMRLDLEGDARADDFDAFDVDRHRLPAGVAAR